MRLLGVVALLLLIAVPAKAQRNCKKGIPCGNSCISASKVCRVGSGNAKKSDASGDSIYQAALTKVRAQGLMGVPDTGLRGVLPWVANVDGFVYYLSSCAPAKRITPEEAVYFATENDAARGGYRRSKAKGC